MPKYLFLISICFSVYKLQGQCISSAPNSPACNEIIRTDPNPKHASNPERPSMTNTFDWTENLWRVYHPLPSVFHLNNVQSVNIESPFYTTDSKLSMINFHSLPRDKHLKTNLDFHPEDGWELLYKHNGITLDGQTITLNQRVGPFFMLYNRYTGKVRILAALPATESENFITTVKFRQTSGLKFSGLLGKHTGTIRALDRESAVIKAFQSSKGALPNNFFVSEFNTNYDPCICNTKSELEISFAKEQTATLKAYGRLIATSVPLDVPLRNGRDFLTSVYTDGSDKVQAGSITYRNIDQLKQDYGSSGGTASKIFKIALDIALPAVGSKLGKLLAEPAEKILTNDKVKKILEKFGVDTDKLPDKEELEASLGELGKNAKQLSTVLFPAPSTPPNISFIEGELALSGTIIAGTDIGSNVIIATPGSKYSNDSLITQDRFYPLYNEALGVFALLETPKVKYHYYEDDGESWGGRDKHYLKLDPNPIKYYFNPAAEVNVHKTRIYAALVFDLTSCSSKNGFYTTLNRIQKNSSLFITDFYPLEVLPQVAGYISILENSHCRPGPVSLRLQIFYESNPNRYGKVIKSYEILDFATEQVDTDSPQFTTLPSKLPQNITIYGLNNSTLRTSIGNFNMNQNQTLKALNNITINGNLQGLSKSLSLIAGNSVIVNNNVTIGNNVSFETKTFDNVYDIPKTQPVSPAYVKNFCNRGTYKANIYRRLARVSLKQEDAIYDLPVEAELIDLESTLEDDIIFFPFLPDQDIIIDTLDASDSTDIDIDAEDVDLDSVEINRRRINSKVKIYPNPTTGLTHIKLDFAEAQDVSITVYTVLGVKVYEVNLSNVKATVYDLDLTGQASGMYLVSIVGTKDVFQEQVWIE